MKIIFTGGGAGGHFYPIVAIVQAIDKLVKEKHLIKPDMYYFSPSPYNPGLLYDLGVEYNKTTAGKVRRYFSILNFFDLFKTAWGVLSATLDVFDIYPDVVFGKGGYASFPTLLAARILRIPVIIHESDSVPGRVNRWAGKFVHRIAISYPQAAGYFTKAQKENKIALTGQPVQHAIMQPITNGAHQFFGFEESVPTVLVLGGSQGSETINNAVMDALPKLLEKFQVTHQTGQANFKVVQETADAVLLNSKHTARYKPFAYMNSLELQMAAGAASVVISRAGSTIFEIAAWGKPLIIIPINEAVSHDQTKNAYAYASTGAASVIEEANLTANILLAEITRVVESVELKLKMEATAKAFFRPDADEMIAKEILSIALSHEELN